MGIHYAARGGRISKLKGQVVSFAPFVSASIVLASTALLGLAAPTAAQDALYNWGSQPTLSSYEDLSKVYQYQTGDLDAVITNGAVSSTTVGSATNPLATDLTQTTVTASVTANKSTGTLGLADVAGTGSASNGLLSNALESLDNTAYAGIINTDISNTSGTPGDGSLVGLSDNSMSASVTLATSTNTLSGAIATGFANTDVGTSTLDPSRGTGLLGTPTASGTAGYLLQSTQVASDIQAQSVANGFALIGSGSTISLSVTDTGTAEKTLLESSGNSLATGFTGNTAQNVVSVQGGGKALLEGTAGVANLQITDLIGNDGTNAVSSATISSDSGISASIDGNLGTSSFALTDNSLSASGAMNAATNTVGLADGISLDGRAAFDNVTTTVSTEDSTISAADLFLNNVQQSADSVLSSNVNGTKGITLSADGSVSNVAVTATGNAIAATSEANANTGLLFAAGANSLDGIVAQSNVQGLVDTLDDEIVSGAFATVTNGTITAGIANTAEDTLSGATIALSDNDVTAKATGNTADLTTFLKGNALTGGGTGATEAPSVSLADASSTAQATYSSVSRQTVQGDAALSDAVVSASLTGDNSIELTAGNTDGSTTQSSIAADGNALSTTAAANSATQLMQISANTLDATAAVANQQSLSGGVLASNVGSDVTVNVERSGDSANMAISGDSNTLSSGAVGNSAKTELVASATSMAPDTLVALGEGALDDSRSLLSLDGAATGNVGGSAGLTLLNSQTTEAILTSTISSTISDADVAVAFETGVDPVSGKLTGIALSADGNGINSMARANVGETTLVATLGSLDMSAAIGTDAAPTTGGTNLAVLGSSQTNTSSVTSSVDAGTAGASDITALVNADTATVAGSSVSADGNDVTSLASGNSATNTFRLSGTTLVTTEATAAAPKLELDAGNASTSTLVATNAAIAVGNEQSNTGAITSTIAGGTGTGTTDISASILSADSVTGSTVSVADNRLMAQAVAASGATTTATIDATSIATTALIGSTQTNTGAVKATIGDTGGVRLLSEIDGAATDSTVSADGNLVAATATALIDSTSLAVGGVKTASLQGAGTLDLGTAMAQSGASAVTISADYGLGESQSNSGAVEAGMKNVTVKAISDNLTGGAATVSSNLLVAQSTAVSATTELSGTATAMTTDAPVTALVTKQVNTGKIDATLTNTELAVSSGAVTGSDLTLAGNALRSVASPLSATNTSSLTATAMDGAAAGLVNDQKNTTGAVTASLTDTTLKITATSATNASVDLGGNAVQAAATGAAATNGVGVKATDMTDATASLLSGQENSSSLTAKLQSTSLSTSTGATSGSVAIDGNMLRAGVTGVSAANTAAATGGQLDGARAALVSRQTNTGPLAATVSDATITATATTLNGSLSLSDNRTIAAATAVLATNRTVVDAGSSILGNSVGGSALSATGAYDLGGTPVALLMSAQTSSGAVSSTIDDLAGDGALSILANLSGTTSGSVAVSGNLMVSQSRGNVADNLVSLSAGASVDASTQAVLGSSQTRNGGAISATVSGWDTTGKIGVEAAALNSGSIVVENNVVRASGSANAAINSMDVTGATVASAGLKSAATTGATPEVATGAQFAVLNAQTNGSAVNARVEAIDLVADTNGSAASGQVALNGNMFMADATGNSAVNNLRLAAAGASAAPIAAVNYQANSAALSATVDSVRLVSSGGASQGTNALAGNSIVATTTGNVASSSVGAMTSY